MNYKIKLQILKKIFVFFFSVSQCFGQGYILDTSYDTDGKVLTPISPESNSIYDIALQSDGKIVAVGYTLTGINYDIAIARYNSDGSLDSSFNFVGFNIIDLGFNDDVGYGVAIQADGKIVVAGSAANVSNTDFVLLRFNIDGTLDGTFDGDGIVITTFGSSYETAYDVAIQSDGKIIATGSAFIDTIYNFAMARYNTNGSLDAGFGTGGKVNTILTNGDEAKSLAIQSDGKIVLAGLSKQFDFSIAFAVARYTTSGTLDTTFNTTGKVITSITPNNDEGRAVAIQTDGKIVVAGKGTPVGPEQFAVVRYNTDGSLDNSWNGTGMLTTAFGSNWDEARTIAIQADGKILAGGLASVPESQFAMARYNIDGTLDVTFGAGGKLTTPFGPLSSIWSFLIQPDNKILVGGYSGTGTDYDFALARYVSNAKPNGIENFGILNNSIVAYPNPVSHENMIIEYCLQKPEKISIQLLTIEGKIIKTFISGLVQAVGQYNHNLFLPENLTAGQYYIVISSANEMASIKIIRQ